jgi:XTP/dITP diphosphohydrolase
MDLEIIARSKAEEAFQKIGKPVLVEDTGWYFDAWNGLPGPFAKWFKETAGIDGVLRMMSCEENRKAIGKTAVAYHDGKDVHVFVAEISGIITREKRGDSGFAYDSIFIPDDQKKTFGEMTTKEKNSVSMRALAVEKLKKFLETQGV